MKKWIALILSILMIFSLASCGASPSEVVDEMNDLVEDVKEEIAPKMVRGTVEGEVYTNTTAGLKFTKPAAWVYSTDEELAALMDAGAEVVGIEDLEEALEDTGTVYDMMVSDPTTGTNVNVMYENLAKSFASKMTEEQYVEVLENQFANISTMTVTLEEETAKVKLGENEYLRAIANTEVSGISMKQVFYLKNFDGVMLICTVTLVSGHEIADIEAMFS